MRRRLWIVAGSVALAVLVILGAVGGRSEAPGYETAVIDRGDVVEVVGATGILEAVTTVQVGSQVSGTVAWLGADFNAQVKKGQVVARLEPSLFEARVAQARSNRVAAEAQVERSVAAALDARQKYERAQALHAQRLLPESDLESAKATHESAAAQRRANEAAVGQAAAALHQAEVDLGHSVIVAPIDGVVLARNVDVGQTVAASLQAPTLFVIANDLKRMRVNVAIDEANIGRVREGQPVRFRVDAWPEEEFEGRVEQVRLQPIVNQNVVTYNALVAVANDALKLRPGMTATVSVETRRREGVLRAPAAAVRFRPDPVEAAAPRTGGLREASRGARPRSLYVPGARGRPEAREVRLGLADGRFVEILEGLREGDAVITGLRGVASAAGPKPAPSAANNPFAPRREPRTR